MHLYTHKNKFTYHSNNDDDVYIRVTYILTICITLINMRSRREGREGGVEGGREGGRERGSVGGWVGGRMTGG
jgi:hypothetical protein